MVWALSHAVLEEGVELGRKVAPARSGWLKFAHCAREVARLLMPVAVGSSSHVVLERG